MNFFKYFILTNLNNDIIFNIFIYNFDIKSIIMKDNITIFKKLIFYYSQKIIKKLFFYVLYIIQLIFVNFI